MINTLADTNDIRVTITKKSGPGDLIGITEGYFRYGTVVFDGLQFNEPGEYILIATPESEYLASVEVKVVVKEVAIIAQESKLENNQTPEQATGTRPIITQIDPPNTELNPIEYDATKSPDNNNDIATGIGLLPFFWYNGYQIDARYIKFLEIYYDGMIPCASVSFTDSMGMIKKDGQPLDNTKFEIFLNSGSKNLKSIHLRFKIISFDERKDGSYKIQGCLDLKDFYKIRYEGYSGTSFEVLRKISNELGLGFNSNISNTNDSMNWLNDGKLFKDYINDILYHSYISDSSYVLGYIDYYYCFNYVDIEKEWLRDISNDVGIHSRGINFLNSDGSEQISKLLLTNDRSADASPFGFNTYRLNNKSTKTSFTHGYFTTSKAYDSETKSFLIFDVDVQNNDGSDTILLKGAPRDNSDLKDNYRTNYGGKIDSDNVHKQYYYAVVQNKINIENLQRISVELIIPSPNFNLYKLMKIQLNFINENPSVTNDELITSRLTGEWIISDIKFRYSQGTLVQKVTCVRKDLGKTLEEKQADAKASTPIEQQTNINNENNVNQLAPNDVIEQSMVRSSLTPPNSRYKVGERYIVKDSSGKQFRVTITELLSDGISIRTKVEAL